MNDEIEDPDRLRRIVEELENCGDGPHTFKSKEVQDAIEKAYRRGYQQGSAVTYRALKAGGSLDEVHRWEVDDLAHWRFDRPVTELIDPPGPPSLLHDPNEEGST